jgi:fibronectin type 3 domain-containing protein
MKNFIAIISSAVLIVSFSGCEGKNFGLGNISMPKMSVPSFDMSNKVLDRKLPTVQNLKIESSISEVALEWKPMRERHIAGYRIFRNNDDGGYSLIKTISDPYAAHYTDKNTNQHKYSRYMVSTYTEDGRVSLPKKISIQKMAKSIDPVPYIAAVSGLPNRVKVLWRIHPDHRVTGYVIQRLDLNTKTWVNIKEIDKRLSVEFIDTTVSPGTTYSYRILAKTEDGVYSRASSVATGKSKLLPPPIIGLMATTNFPKRVELIWKKSPQTDIHHYNIYASNFADSMFSLIAKTRSTSYIDKFDEDGAIRFYRVTAVDVDGLESSKGTKPVKGMTLGYLVPPVITSARIINNKVELKWENKDNRTASYTIYKSFWNGWKIKKIKIVGFNGTTFVDPKINPDTDYTYYVKAVDKNGIVSEKSRSINVQIEGKTKKSKSWF